MKINKVEALACPLCYQSLTYHLTRLEGQYIIEGVFTCSNCQKSFPITNGIPNFLIVQHNDKVKNWILSQKNFLKYVQRRMSSKKSSNQTVIQQQIYEKLTNLIRFKEPILDVGSGTCWLYNFLKRDDYFGIDPIDPVKSRPDMFSKKIFYLNFIQGTGEYLPFKSNFFSTVLFLASLQHMIEPKYVLFQAERVLRMGGEIVIMAPYCGKIYNKLFKIFKLLIYGELEEIFYMIKRNLFKKEQCKRYNITKTMLDDILPPTLHIDEIIRDGEHIFIKLIKK